jgi:hypothetical protein
MLKHVRNSTVAFASSVWQGASDEPGSDLLFFLTMPLVLLQEDAPPVATPVSSPVAHEEEEEATDEPGSDRLFFLTMPLVGDDP